MRIKKRTKAGIAIIYDLEKKEGWDVKKIVEILD